MHRVLHGAEHPTRRPPTSIQLSDTVRLTATGAVELYVIGLVDHEDFVPPSFRIEGQDVDLYLDPVVVDDGAPADLLFITHAHTDHLSLPDIDRLSGPETQVVGPRPVAKKLGDRPHQLVAPGDRGELGGVGYEALPAYNLRRGSLGFKPHPPGDGHVGYVVEVDGVRILHPGDTDRLPEHDALEDIDVALLPIDGGDLSMSTEGEARQRGSRPGAFRTRHRRRPDRILNALPRHRATAADPERGGHPPEVTAWWRRCSRNQSNSSASA